MFNTQPYSSHGLNNDKIKNIVKFITVNIRHFLAESLNSQIITYWKLSKENLSKILFKSCKTEDRVQLYNMTENIAYTRTTTKPVFYFALFIELSNFLFRKDIY